MKLKINFFTYLFFLLAFLCGYFKNVCIIFFIVIFHELGHVFLIKLFSYPIKEIEIYPFGGITKIDKPINSSINKELLISFGGVFTQIIMQFLSLFIIKDLEFYKLFTFYNYSIIFFNLIPMYPLDGSKIINLLLEKVLPYKKALLFTNKICFGTLILFTILNIFTKEKNITICLFLIIIYFYNIKDIPYLLERFYLERYLYNFPYKRIKNHKKENIYLLKKNTLHFFYKNGYYKHEKAVLKDVFNNINSFE